MRFAKVINVSIALSLLLCGAYSAAALDVSSKNHSHSHKGYYKPGAAVTLSYDYDGETQLGELENLTLTLNHYYSGGYISARLLETRELQILSHRTLENEKLYAGSSLHLPIQISGTKTGEYFVSLEIIYENLSSERSLRVLSLPVQIGSVSKSKNVRKSPEKSKSDTEKGFIILEAQEVIK